MASRFTDQADLNVLRGVLSQDDALNRIQENFRKRYSLIKHSIAANVANASQGQSIGSSLQSFRGLANAVGTHIQGYRAGQALPDNGRNLAALLFEMLEYIISADEDLYANARIPRAQYAGGGNTGNLFREFVREHMGIMEVLLRLPVPLLRDRRLIFRNIIQRVRDHGPSNGDAAQYQQLLNVMARIWDGELRSIVSSIHIDSANSCASHAG